MQVGTLKMSYRNGFTLIEVMIVVAVIGIIAAIAIPSYSSSILKSKRQMGKGELLEVLARQEQFFVNNKAYATNLTALGYSANPYYINDDGAQTSAGSSIYLISLVSPSTTAFSIRATPQNGQTDDSQCASLQVSSSGQKTIVGGSSTASSCW
jgi:type IV pilus assembly protein PilE